VRVDLTFDPDDVYCTQVQAEPAVEQRCLTDEQIRQIEAMLARMKSSGLVTIRVRKGRIKEIVAKVWY